MRKTIVRSIVASTVKSSNVLFVKGVPTITENAPIVVSGKVDEKQALKEVRKAYGESAQVTEISAVNDVYEISVEDFMRYAKKVEPKPEGEGASADQSN
jgi:hypothetical protein